MNAEKWLKHKWYWLILLSCCWFFLGGRTRPVQAADTGSDFTIVPDFGSGQTDDQLAYYSLKTQPGQQYPLTVTVSNLSPTEELAFTVQLVAATTTDQGEINYTPATTAPDKSAAVLLPALADDQATTRTITLAPASKQQVTFDLTMPQAPLKGTVLGSVYVQRKTTSGTSQGQLGIKNQFAMALPVMLVQAGQTGLAPQLALTAIKPKATGGVATLIASIHNSAPVLFGQIALDARVYRAGAKQVLFEQTDHNYKMAPNSTLDYHINTAGKSLAPGHYQLKIKLTSGASVFNLERRFTIKKTTAAATDRQLIQKRTHYPWLLWLLIGFGVITLGALVFIWHKMREIKSRLKH